MPRRRQHTEPGATSELPAQLQRFNPLDWIQPDERPPPWWANDEHTWQQVRGLRRYLNALEAWAADHGTTRWELRNPLWERHRHTGTSCPVPLPPSCQT